MRNKPTPFTPAQKDALPKKTWWLCAPQDFAARQKIEQARMRWTKFGQTTGVDTLGGDVPRARPIS